LPAASQERSDSATVVEAGIVARGMDHAVTAELTSQIVQVGDKQGCNPASPGSRQEQPTGPPMQRSRVPRRKNNCFTF
jgi:hypothetical protein